MEQQIKRVLQRVVRNAVARVTGSETLAAVSDTLADAIAHRLALESMFQSPVGDKAPHEVFRGVSDNFWFWLCTEGYRRSPSVRALLPGMPDEEIQLQFTGSKGHVALREAFSSYVLFRDLYQQHVEPIDQCEGILDFGCGWGRIIRFFLKDVEPTELWGADPVEEMIEICRRDNKWSRFERIDPMPPSPFPDDRFGLIYSFSVFSHLSEDMHKTCLAELHRIVKPGGLLIVTTRSRQFIQSCADMRKRRDLKSLHPGPRSSSSAFVDTQRSLADYDNGDFCFSPLPIGGNWSYWGEAAISRDYVLRNWSKRLTFVDYIDDWERCNQAVIVMRKPR